MDLDKLKAMRRRIKGSSSLSGSAVDLSTPEEIAMREDPEMLKKIGKGLLIGLNQEGQMADAASREGVALEDPSIQAGIKVMQGFKLGGEFVLTEALTGGLGGPILAAMKTSPKVASLVNKAAQAEKLVEKGSNANQVMRTIGDFAKGAGIAAGANLGVNTTAAGLAELVNPESFSANMSETSGEAAGQGLVGGALNAALAPAIRTYARNLGAKQLKRDVGEELTNQAAKATQAAESDSVAAVKKIYNAREAELAPIREAVNAAEDAVVNSQNIIQINKLPNELKDFITKFQEGKFGNQLKKSTEAGDLNNIFKGKSFKETPTSNLGGTKVSVTGDTITENELYRTYKAIKELSQKGSTQGGEFAIAKGQIDKHGVLGAALKTLPKDLQTAEKNFQKTYEKWGSAFDPNYKDLNKIYDKLSKNQIISEEEALKALKADNSSKAKKIGSFVDEGVLTVSEVQGANINAAGKKGETFFPVKATGPKGESINLLKQGLKQEEVAAIEGERLGNVSIFEKLKRATGKGSVMPDAATASTGRMLDPLEQASGLTPIEKNLTTALGTSPEAAQVSSNLDTLQYLKQHAVQEAKGAASEASMGQKLMQGFDAGSVNPQAVSTALARTQLLNQLGPQAVRSILQSPGTWFLGNNEFGLSGR